MFAITALSDPSKPNAHACGLRLNDLSLPKTFAAPQLGCSNQKHGHNSFPMLLFITRQISLHALAEMIHGHLIEETDGRELTRSVSEGEP